MALKHVNSCRIGEYVHSSPQGVQLVKRGKAPRLQQTESILKLSRSQQRFVMQLLDTVIAQASR